MGDPMTTYRVTGVFHTNTSREEVVRTVEGPYPEWAISVVNCEALKVGKLFNSAKAEAVDDKIAHKCALCGQWGAEEDMVQDEHDPDLWVCKDCVE